MPILAVWNPYTPTVERLTLLGDDLRLTIPRRQLTTAQAAEQIGIGLTTLNGLINNTTNPTKATIVAALRWLAADR